MMKLYQVLVKYPDMPRAMRVDAGRGMLVSRKFHASLFTSEQADKYIALHVDDDAVLRKVSA